MSFKQWFDNADIPTRDKDGKWFDAEDGFYYSDYTKHEETKYLTKLDKQKIELHARIDAFKKREWATIPLEEKQEFYQWIQDKKVLDAKRNPPRKKLMGNTYKFKDQIKEKGGEWNSKGKYWLVPAECHKSLFEMVSN